MYNGFILFCALNAVEGMVINMNEQMLQDLSRALTHPVYRNTAVEDLHMAGAVLDDKTMKIINKEVNNRIYTLLNWYLLGTDEERTQLEKLVNWAANFGRNSWDKAEMLDITKF